MSLPFAWLCGKRRAGSGRDAGSPATLHPYGWLFAAALATLPATAHAGSTTAEANVVTVHPLSLIKTQDLDFGDVAVGATAGTVNIDPATGARTVTGGVVAMGGSAQQAEFVGAARRGIVLRIVLGPSPTLLRVGGGASMTTALAVEGGTGVRIFPGTGAMTFRVGGRLNVAANQQPGSYRGQFTLTVNYN